MMHAKTFDDILEYRLDKTRRVLASKAEEYASCDDRMHNFRRAAALQGTTPALALVGMWSKHVVSVLDLARKQAAGGLVPREVIDEKVGDAVNYLILLEALLKEHAT